MKDLVLQLRQSPSSVLSRPCVLALGAFLFGYKAADAGAAPILLALQGKYPGPDQADACSRAYLSGRRTEDELHIVLDALSALVSEIGYQPALGPGASDTFVGFVREAIEQGRPAMVLLEPTVTWLYDFSSGFGHGLEAVQPKLAATQRSQIRDFEEWLQGEYQSRGAPWYRILRIYEGMGERGLARFIELWDEFRSTTGSQGV